MALIDEDMEESVSPLILDTQKSNQSVDAISPEDVAWVDSCLIIESDILESDWTSMRDALHNIASSQIDSLNTTAAGGGHISATDTEILPWSLEAETALYMGRNDESLLPINEEGENSVNDDIPMKKKTGPFFSKTSFENAFLPGFNDDMIEFENLDVGSDLGFSAFDMELSTEDIFRVWDLNITNDEEDEVLKQLTKALAGGSLQSTTPPSSSDSKAWKYESLDNIIAGMADLSLIQNSV